MIIRIISVESVDDDLLVTLTVRGKILKLLIPDTDSFAAHQAFDGNIVGLNLVTKGHYV